MSEDLAAELSKLQGTWKDTAPGGGTVIPDGNYNFVITKAELGKSKNSGRLQVATGVKIITGEHAGKTHISYSGLDSEKSIGFFKKDMQRLEQKLPENLSELPAWLPRLVGITFLAQVKNKDGFTNVYITKRVTIDPTAATQVAPGMGAAPSTGSPKLGM